MNPSLFFWALRARFGLFILACGATVMAATVLSLLLPKSYRATASLVVDTREEQSLSNALNALVSPRERMGYIQTQVDIITSPKVAHKVVNDLELTHRPSLRENFEKAAEEGGSIENWLVEGLLRAVEVETSQSSVIHVSFNAEDPNDAAEIANGFAQAYMDTMLELRVEPTRQAAAWFNEQLQTLRADLEAAQARMTDFQQQHSIVSVDESLDEDYGRLAELSNQLLGAQEQAVELKVREHQARQLLALGAPLDAQPDIQANAHIQELAAGLLDSEARLDRLATQYGPNHPEYRRELAETTSRRDTLQAEMRKVVATLENQRRQAEQRAADIAATLASQRERVLQLKESRDELTVLMRNVDSAQSAYNTAMERFVVSQVESRASQTNVAMLNRAMAPLEPHRPNVMLNVALALVVGTLLGTALVILAETSDRRVRSAADLIQDTNVPLIGEIDAWRPAKSLAPARRLLLTGPAGEGTGVPEGK